jgi:hypothetical protein
MFQVFHTDVAKVDHDAVHVVMAIHVCFKYMLQMFHLFQTNVASVLSGRYIYMHVASICFKCFSVFHTYICKHFILTLHMFAMVFKCFWDVFASVSDACFKCFICFFMLQLLHMDISKVAQVLHMGCAWEAAGRRTTFGQCGPIAGGLAREPDALDAHALPVRAASGC